MEWTVAAFRKPYECVWSRVTSRSFDGELGDMDCYWYYHDTEPRALWNRHSRHLPGRQLQTFSSSCDVCTLRSHWNHCRRSQHWLAYAHLVEESLWQERCDIPWIWESILTFSSQLSRALRAMSEPPPEISFNILVNQVAKDIVAAEKLRVLEARRDVGRAVQERRGAPDRHRRDVRVPTWWTAVIMIMDRQLENNPSFLHYTWLKVNEWNSEEHSPKIVPQMTVLKLSSPEPGLLCLFSVFFDNGWTNKQSDGRQTNNEDERW